MVTIDRTELLELIERGFDPVLIETLAWSAYEQAHLPGAVNMPPEIARELAAELVPDRATLIVLYGAGPQCDASARVAVLLEAIGYDNVHHYVGGKTDWFAAGLRMQVIGGSSLVKRGDAPNPVP